MAALHQFLHQLAADEQGAPDNQYFHMLPEIETRLDGETSRRVFGIFQKILRLVVIFQAQVRDQVLAGHPAQRIL